MVRNEHFEVTDEELFWESDFVDEADWLAHEPQVEPAPPRGRAASAPPGLPRGGPPPAGARRAVPGWRGLQGTTPEPGESRTRQRRRLGRPPWRRWLVAPRRPQRRRRVRRPPPRPATN